MSDIKASDMCFDSPWQDEDESLYERALDSLEADIRFIRKEELVAGTVDYLAARVESCARCYRRAASYGSELHAGYVPFIERLVSLLDPLPNKERILHKATLATRLFQSRGLTIPNSREPGEGEVRVSVVVPVYNPGEGIHACIESLRSQLLDGLEFIFVDDCSTDESMSAVETWAAEDGRVRILRNEQNLGAGPTRNRGIEEARGDYLSFIDPDDYVSPCFHELLYAAAMADGGHDIAKGLRIEIDAQGEKSDVHGRQTNDSIVSRPSNRPLYLRFSGDHWTALYKRSLFEDGTVRYGTSRKSQDTTFTLRVCHKTDDIAIVPEATYHYFTDRTGSAVNQRNARQLKYELDGFREKVAFFEETGFDTNARRYLLSKLHLYLSHCFVNLRSNPSIASELEGLANSLEHIVEAVPSLRFLQDDCRFRAFVEHLEPLPDIRFLPLDLKLEGVSQWVAFVSRHPHCGLGSLDACAKAMALYVEQLTRRKGFRAAYAQMAEQARTLPPQRRYVIWLALNCHLASARNVRRALGKASRTALERWQRRRNHG